MPLAAQFRIGIYNAAQYADWNDFIKEYICIAHAPDVSPVINWFFYRDIYN